MRKFEIKTNVSEEVNVKIGTFDQLRINAWIKIKKTHIWQLKQI